MKIYVDKKDCSTCSFANKTLNYICGDVIANNIGLKNCASRCSINYFATAEQDCPLHLLEEHDKEVRKQVRDEVSDYLEDYGFYVAEWEDLLDQIEKGDKE